MTGDLLSVIFNPEAEKFLIDFSTLIYILFVNVSTDLTNITGDPY